MPLQVPLAFQIIPGGNDPAVAAIGVHTSANTTLTSKVETVYVNTTGGAYTVTMPASPNNYEPKLFKDVGGTLTVDACTVSGNGHDLEQDDGSFAATYVMAQNRQQVAWRYSATLSKWARTSATGGGGGGQTVVVTPTSYGSETFTPTASQENILIDNTAGDVTIILEAAPAVNTVHWIYMFGGLYFDLNTVKTGAPSHTLEVAGHGSYDDTTGFTMNPQRPTLRVAWDGTKWQAFTVVGDPGYFEIYPTYSIGPPPGPHTETLPLGSCTVGVNGSDVLGSGFTFTLPADVDGTKKIIKDISGTAAARNIVLNPTSGNIEQFAGGYAAGLTLNANGDSATLVKTSLGWRLV